KADPLVALAGRINATAWRADKLDARGNRLLGRADLGRQLQRQALELFVEVGRWLIEAKKQCQARRRGWLAWQQQHLTMGPRMARRYVLVPSFWGRIGHSVSSLRHAVELIQRLRPPRRRRPPPAPAPAAAQFTSKEQGDDDQRQRADWSAPW